MTSSQRRVNICRCFTFRKYVMVDRIITYLILFLFKVQRKLWFLWNKNEMQISWHLICPKMDFQPPVFMGLYKEHNLNSNVWLKKTYVR